MHPEASGRCRRLRHPVTGSGRPHARCANNISRSDNYYVTPASTTVVDLLAPLSTTSIIPHQPVASLLSTAASSATAIAKVNGLARVCDGVVVARRR